MWEWNDNLYFDEKHELAFWLRNMFYYLRTIQIFSIVRNDEIGFFLSVVVGEGFGEPCRGRDSSCMKSLCVSVAYVV